MPIVVVNKERISVLVFAYDSIGFKRVETFVIGNGLEENATSLFNGSIVAIKRFVAIGFSVSEILNDHIAKECDKQRTPKEGKIVVMGPHGQGNSY